MYVSVTKKCTNYANEESYKILNGAIELETSASFGNNEQRTNEFCLPSTTNSQYTFKIIDAYGDSWAAGAWVSVAGLYGNVVLKATLVEKFQEEYALSLYYPVTKSAEWKMYTSASSVDPNWNTLNFSDGSWNTVTLGSVSAVSGTQYFRKSLTGLPNMAAYEVSMNYKFGIIAYVNGVEIFRDHMNDGAVSPSTPSNGAFTDYEYHGFIRPAKEIESSSVLAVELHFPTTGDNSVDFNAYVASLASSLPVAQTEKCYVYAYPVTITASGGTNPANIFNFGKTDYYFAAANVLPATVSYELTGPRAHVNGVRVWPYTLLNQAPGTFTLAGAMSSSSTYTNVVPVSGARYASNTYKLFYGYFNAKAFQSYRLTLTAGANMGVVDAVEVQPVTCADMLPAGLDFEETAYTAYAKHSSLNIRPTNQEFVDCQIAPALPAGLTFTAATCTITGKVTNVMTQTTFTMTSTMQGQNYQGTFSLQVIDCTATLVNVLRTYKASGQLESFSIKDATTQQVVLSVTANSGQPSSMDWSVFVCLTNAKYEIDVGSTGTAWSEASDLYLNAVLAEDEYETIARMRYDADLGLAEDRVIFAQWSVAPQSQWFYKMNEVPANWYSADTSGWNTGAMGGFTGATNQIQLYKQTFSISSLTDVAGFVISLRYLYGCVIYMNGNEVFRNGVTGDLSASSIGLNAYTNLHYHQISLPKTVTSSSGAAVNYLQEGTNTIAIAIVAQTSSQTNSVFDAALRLMDGVGNTRLFDCTVDYDDFDNGYPDDLPNLHNVNFIGMDSCMDNYWGIAFENDRREWVNAIDVFLQFEQEDMFPAQFTLKARNSNLEAWTTLRTVTGMTWSLAGEHKIVWLSNDKPWNQYRFENIGTGDATDCDWQLGGFNLFASNVPTNIPDLTYTSPILITVGIEMGEIYANSDYYFDFTVTPAFPEGISLDFNTGKISGTCNVQSPSTVYQITASRVGGGSVTVPVTLSVEPCTGERHLITLVARLDSWPSEGSYKLYSGKGTSGQVVASINAFKVANGLNYGDFCVANGIYTLVLSDSNSDGWNNPAGYYMTVDVGTMIFEMGQFPRSTPSISTMFSSLLPFQIETDSWKVWNKQEAVAADWTSVSFDDSAWETKKAAELGNHMGTTAFVRHEVNVPSIDDYHVLNVRVKYTGGVVVFFNGVKVARFNLADNYDASTEAVAVHDATLFSKFHVVLPTASAVTGKNVIAFEIHRAPGQSELVFDATAVFGVNDCSVVVDTFSEIDASEVSGCTKEDLLDILPTTYGHIPNAAGSFLSWTVENLEGSKFNTFALQTNNIATGYGFSVYGRWEATDEYTSALEVRDQTTKQQDRNSWDMPVGIAGFTQLRFVVDSVASTTVSTNGYAMVYCKSSASGSCPAVGEYPGVGEGEISPAKCVEGFRGYSYRTCTNGVLGEVQTDKCDYKLPANIEYTNPNMEFVMGTEVTSGKPSYKNIIQEFFMQDSTPLPEGLKLDSVTGEITGIPVATMDTKSFTVRGKNPKGETFVAITISVRKGRCAPEGVFDRTPVGETAVYQCAMQGSYVGTQKRACVLGKKDGEWQKATGFCMPVFTIVLLVVVVIVIVVVVVLILMRSRKTKAVGGVKGKGGKSTASKKGAAKKTPTKAVKV